MGGAEGTRTPDPHAARAAACGLLESLNVRSRRSNGYPAVYGSPRTTVNAIVGPPPWHHTLAA
jgi:integrase